MITLARKRNCLAESLPWMNRTDRKKKLLFGARIQQKYTFRAGHKRKSHPQGMAFSTYHF